MWYAQSRLQFELGPLGPYTSLVLPLLYSEFRGEPFDLDVERQRIADTLPWFKELVSPRANGLYSWHNS